MQDLDYAVENEKGVIIVSVDAVEYLRLDFHQGVRVQVLYNAFKVEKDQFHISSPPEKTSFTLPVVEETEYKEETIINNKKGKETHTSEVECISSSSERENVVSPPQTFDFTEKDVRRNSHDAFVRLERTAEVPAPCDNEYYCETCNESFETRPAYRHHMELHKTRKRGRKPKGKTGKSQRSKESKKSCSRTKREARYPCEICGNMFTSEGMLSRHLKAKHKRDGEENVQDSLELDVTESRKIKMLSLPSVKSDSLTDNAPVECEICEKIFYGLGKYRRHKRFVHGVNRRGRYNKETSEQLCNICGETFPSERVYNIHKRQHGIVCEICKESFRTIGLLRHHVKELHMEDVDEHGNKRVKPCPKCFCLYFSAEKLEEHMLKHEKGRVYICHRCGKSFTNKATICFHISRHHSSKTTERPYPCDQCGRIFKDSPRLWDHITRMHKEPGFKCKFCPKQFHKSFSLKIHMRTHSKEQPYKCEVCGKAFSQSYNLTIHLRTHTKEKPFTCDYCGQKFSHKCSLQGHIRSKHSVESIESHISQSSMTSQSMNNHLMYESMTSRPLFQPIFNKDELS